MSNGNVGLVGLFLTVLGPVGTLQGLTSFQSVVILRRPCQKSGLNLLGTTDNKPKLFNMEFFHMQCIGQ